MTDVKEFIRKTLNDFHFEDISIDNVATGEYYGIGRVAIFVVDGKEIDALIVESMYQ